MRLFDWLKPKAEPHIVTPSALTQILEGGNAVALDQGQTYVKLAQVKYPEGKRIADSLREFPDDWAWRHKGYELEHVPSGFCMWVANKDYGLAEMTSHGGKQKFEEPEQAIIWPAVEAWLAHGKVGFTGRLPKVSITGKRGTYWCVSDAHPWAGVGDSPAQAYQSWAQAVSIEQRRTHPEKKLAVWSAPQ